MSKLINTLKKKDKYFYIHLGIVLFAFCVYAYWAMRLPQGKAPDEYMRYPIAEWIYNNNKLPIGNEPELINPIWGFSYGFTPYFPSLVSVLFMKIMSIVKTSPAALLIAARGVSVVAGTGTVICAFGIGKRLFKKESSIILFAVLVGFLPQYVFLCSYLNNDAFATFTCTWIILCWLQCKEAHWNYKSCAILAIPISLLALSYYNAYAYILCSIFVFIYEIIKDPTIENKWKHIVTHALFIIGIFLVLAGWFFIRNAIIHNGDFLGMKSMYDCGEIYAMDEYKMSNRLTMERQGHSFLSILFSREWIEYTYRSFIGMFGYMDIVLQSSYYRIYTAIFCVGGIGAIYSFIKNKKNWFFYLILLLCILIPIFLSGFYSWRTDYQPQGRYIMSCLPALALLFTYGYNEIDNKIKGTNTFVYLLWMILLYGIFVDVIYPFCIGSVL